jgi:hypothetical protein
VLFPAAADFLAVQPVIRGSIQLINQILGRLRPGGLHRVCRLISGLWIVFVFRHL